MHAHGQSVLVRQRHPSVPYFTNPYFPCSPACPESSDDICASHGTCVAQPAGIAGKCSCATRWAGHDCTESRLPELTCSTTGATVVAYEFDNLGANAVNVLACQEVGCGSGSPQVQCTQRGQPHTNVDLMVDSSTIYLSVQYCIANTTDCMNLHQDHTLNATTHVWQPPLGTPSTQQVFCTADADCAKQVRKRVLFGSAVCSTCVCSTMHTHTHQSGTSFQAPDCVPRVHESSPNWHVCIGTPPHRHNHNTIR